MMRLTNRQYFYIVVIIGLAIYNGVRIYRARYAAPAAVAVNLTPGTSPTWSIYDDAAKYRDGADQQFQTVLRALNQSIDSANSISVPPQTSKAELADLSGCRTWLLFYRQEFLHPSINRPGWRDQTLRHILSCAQNHRDDSR